MEADDCFKIEKGNSLGIMIKNVPSSLVYTYNFTSPISLTYSAKYNPLVVNTTVEFKRFIIPLQFSIFFTIMPGKDLYYYLYYYSSMNGNLIGLINYA